MMFMAATTISAAINMITAAVSTEQDGPDHLPTNPFQVFAMRVRQLILQHRQQIRDDVQPLRQERNPLVHLEVTAHGLVYGVELGLRPHQLRRVEHGALQVDVDAEDEQLADLHVDLLPGQVDLARRCDLGGNSLGRFNGVVDDVFV
jgi:hypothetical protein